LARLVIAAFTGGVAILLWRIFQLIQSTLDILTGDRHLPKHSLQLPLPRIGTLSERRDFRISLGQVARELPHYLRGACVRNQSLDMRVIG
jgi:hypothetical protein